MDKIKAGIQCRGMDIRKGRDVDVRNGREMVAGLNRKREDPTSPYGGENTGIRCRGKDIQKGRIASGRIETGAEIQGGAQNKEKPASDAGEKKKGIR